ncbi:MAG: DNA modification methylase [Acidobacteria bacterium]|nr:MAG: DNA modification methylase [Acidobacteriota bacterium]
MSSSIQTRQLELYDSSRKSPDNFKNTTSTFSDNLSLPIHRWFRYSAGFSATWAYQLLMSQRNHQPERVLDPFAGSGTTILEAERCGCESIGIEAHPFVARVTRAKLMWRSEVSVFQRFAERILDYASRNLIAPENPPKLMTRCFPPESLTRLYSIRRAWVNLADCSAASELTWLAMMSIIRECSPVGTAQWQYVLPNKAKAKSLDPFKAFSAKVMMFAKDMLHRQAEPHGPAPTFELDDARLCNSVPDGWATFVITSPPYANNYDYADATRLEMTFAGEVESWGDLQETVRTYLVRSCSQHVAPIASETEELIRNPILRPIVKELSQVCRELEVQRDHHGGRKTYHTMIAAYFLDMATVWTALRRASAPGSLACFVIGDSAPYGIYVPVDQWLGNLAVAAGFKSFHFEKTRDRNVKWKNRKHRVPLKEGRLWVQG